ncbi:hypothetical protein A2714_05275 [Candidatus Woesebacteria bacterium RIFCSPHIGHO2_01_FULL_38_9]|uniref:Uncharacterized protein n=2 Tax=Candidatus Woeseibacteriota TaxID=1752722 RepID=A0A1F7Y2Z0_9BACT|nr:MAG: hypothetical protein A2714_05275 [Candidatus Woesebacteria bacterium RIFCSPHIGHO2_01_FULL_38_9]OGM59073.1 MAG: hypothetical protein A3A75_05405 [Candidatus Woesebacteria bacterium RIFCSPLOWO2_01_FULL_39_10]
MSPFLESETSLKELRYAKFVRDGGTIAYDDPVIGHDIIAKNHGLGEPINPSGYTMQKRLVDDAGSTEPLRFGDNTSPVRFVNFSTTCKLRGNKEDARKLTTQTAKEILGNDKVAD